MTRPRNNSARRVPTRIRRWVCLAMGFGMLLLPAGGCRSTGNPGLTGHEPLPVWPPPPAKARIAYVASIGGPVDLGARLSIWRRAANALVGANRGREPFVKPLGIALDEADNLCLTDPGAGVVCYFDREEKRFYRWESVGPFKFISPVAIAKRNGTFYVADSGQGKVVAFDDEQNLLFEITDELQRPTGLAVADQTLWVADAKAHRILKYDLDGRFISTFGHRGTGPGEFNFPTHVSVDGAGRLFVTDSMNFRVQMFDAEGTFRRAFGQAGNTSGCFSRPKGVAVDDAGHVFVVDALFDNVQAFDDQGRLLLYWGSAGSGPGEFWLPAGIAISRDHYIFVADCYNRRIQVFKHLDES